MVTAKKYADRLPPTFAEKARKVSVPWGPLGYVTYKRTYARLREDLGRTEEWADTVERVVNAFLAYGMRMEAKEAQAFAEAFHQLKCLPAGRMLWQAGSPTVDRLGGPSLQNCHMVRVDRPEAFCFAFDMLMLGGGVGFSVLPSDVHKLPPVRGPVDIRRADRADVDFIIPDNREGWVELLRRVLAAFFVTGRGFTYSAHCVRGKGARIKGFGGTASGPEELVRGVSQVCGLLNARSGKHVRPVDALDVMNVIGSVVVAGNVRRSAQIAIGHADDRDYLAAKNWGAGAVPNYRSMSNNSVACADPAGLPEQFWAGYDGSGEPYGLLNLDLMRSHGRLADGPGRYEDPSIVGVNPCGEQGLANFESCCLAELVPANLGSTAELVACAGYLYKVCKTALQLPFSWPESAEVIRRNQRMGLSMTGLCAPHRFGRKDFDSCYKAVRALDRRYSRDLKANPSGRIFTQKPSGTLGLLPGRGYLLPAGLHAGYAEYLFRRVRFSAADPIVDACRRAGYPVEPQVQFDGTPNHDTMVVTFPARSAPGTVLARDLTAVRQLEMARDVQTWWSDNNVSQTVYYRREEVPEVRAWLGANYRVGVKSVSFLLHSDHGFRQAPYEEVTRDQYEALAARARPIAVIDDARQWDLVDSMECAGGACPVK